MIQHNSEGLSRKYLCALRAPAIKKTKDKEKFWKKKSERNEVRVGTPYLCLNKELHPTSAQKSCKKERSEVQYVFRENAINLEFCRPQNCSLKVEDK